MIMGSHRREMFWDAQEIYEEDGFWYCASFTEQVAAFRSQFQPRNRDVLLTSFPKTGTTWLMALCHNILNLHDEDEQGDRDDVLARTNPHEVVPTLDVFFLADHFQNLLLPRSNDDDDDDAPSGGRLLHSHLPYSGLPESVKSSGGRCKIVHVTRNPKDTVVSMWHFFNKIIKPANDEAPRHPFPLERVVESFCSGAVPFGPFYEHVVGYWEESKKRSDEVLFLRYEELCREPREQVRKLAEFLGKPFREGEDAEVDKVLWRSSLNRLKELEVNKNGVGEVTNLPNTTFFRKGTVGEWKNHLTPEMAQRIDQLTQSKLQGITGLCLDDF